jgi:uncharacterized protein (DUF58 family)
MTQTPPNPARARPVVPAFNAADGGVTGWQTTTGRQPGRVREASHRWRAFMWSLVYPYRGNRLLLTLPGGIVLAVAAGIAAAAYNTANNILFIALSLLLACLVFSGLLSWVNFRNLSWRLRVPPPMRAGRDHTISIELHNGKRMLPAYGVWFEIAVTDHKGKPRLPLRGRLDAQGTTMLEWTLRPHARGRLTVEVLTIASLFPFGFLKKMVGSELKREVLVWPAPVEYQRMVVASWRQPGGLERAARAGQGGDLLALRAYARGDSNRLVHWKASARLRRLMVRQYAAETQSGFELWVRTAEDEWTRAQQFELMCGLAATLAEDLFRAGRLTSVAIDDEAPLPVRRMHDLERFLDRLALIKPVARHNRAAETAAVVHRANVMTFAPDGARGVVAYIDGEKTATA